MPITGSAIAIASLAVAVVGTAVSAYGQIQQAAAQRTAAREQNEYASRLAAYNQEAKKYNETMREYSARISEQATKVKMEQQRRRGLALLSTQRAEYGASGIGLEGTPLLVMERTADEIDKDIRNMKWSGEVEAWKIRSQLEPPVTNTGGLYKEGSSGWLEAGSTILTGVGSSLLAYGKVPSLGGGGTTYGSSKPIGQPYYDRGWTVQDYG
jgi:hypothetical protein